MEALAETPYRVVFKSEEICDGTITFSRAFQKIETRVFLAFREPERDGHLWVSVAVDLAAELDRSRSVTFVKTYWNLVVPRLRAVLGGV